ncbi:helix-turn-helix transcriptional regulator [Rivihabitans pingtungensis]|uniref:helix-turn-helix transcriptional regulator n=1 Tax=Rivihabitans pingtungensis TaxID=1054498 RepID=UPI000D754DD7|nr:helix-turn-helix transcriptional regulator [Rivihabitans pingtungensis]
MKITEFGKLVRKARLDAEIPLLQMANDLDVSSAFLSGMETGRKKITDVWVHRVKEYFAESYGIDIPKLAEAADVSNKSVSLEGLNPAHQMLIAGFARTSLSAEQMENLKELLAAANAREEKIA